MSTYAFRLTEPTSAEVWTKLTEALSAAGIKLNVGAELIVANDEAASGKATSALKEAGLAYSEVTLSRRSLSIPEMDCPIEERDIQKVLDERKIADVELNVMTRTANFSGDERFVETVIDAVKAAGYEAKRPDTSAVTRHTLAIPEMDCPVEEQDIRKELDRHGIDGVELNVMSRTAVFKGTKKSVTQ